MLPSVFQLPSHSLELLTVTVRVRIQCFHVSSFYHPPSSDSAVSELINTSLEPSLTSKSILVGDFNVNVGNTQDPLFNQVSSLTSLFSLSQIVSQPTHFSPAGSPSIIDVVLSLILYGDLLLLLLLSAPLIILLSSPPSHIYPNPLLYTVNLVERSGSMTWPTLMSLMTLFVPLTNPLLLLKT